MSEPEPAPPPEPEPTPPAPGRGAGTAGALFLLGAAALTLFGTFQNLVIARYIPGSPQAYVISYWDVRVENDTSETAPGGVPFNGVPLLVAVALLLAAAVLGILAATRSSGARLGRTSGLVAVIGATFLTGAVATIAAQEVWWLNLFAMDNTPTGASGTAATPGAGFWLPVVAVGLAAVGAVMAWRQGRSQPGRVEPDTPPLGVPVVVRRLPDAPPD